MQNYKINPIGVAQPTGFLTFINANVCTKKGQTTDFLSLIMTTQSDPIKKLTPATIIIVD